MASLKSLEPRVRLSIRNPKSTSESEFGRGIAELCLGVRERGSLNAAAKAMGMAYSKAWRIIRDTEEALGLQLLERDGAHGSTLTKQADALLDAYFALSDQLQEQAKASLREKL